MGEGRFRVEARRQLEGCRRTPEREDVDWEEGGSHRAKRSRQVLGHVLKEFSRIS